MSAISTAAHAITQQRARAIVDAFGDLDNVGDQSGFAADPCVALVTAAHSAMPMPPRRRRWAFRLPHHLTVFLQTHAHQPPRPGNRQAIEDDDRTPDRRTLGFRRHKVAAFHLMHDVDGHLVTVPVWRAVMRLRFRAFDGRDQLGGKDRRVRAGASDDSGERGGAAGVSCPALALEKSAEQQARGAFMHMAELDNIAVADDVHRGYRAIRRSQLHTVDLKKRIGYGN